MRKSIVVFDFDGVVCDSTDECMVVSWNAWQRMQGRDVKRTRLNEFDQIEYEVFRKLRPFVRGGGEYYVLWRWMSRRCEAMTYSDYEFYCREWEKYFKAFKKIFYQERDHLRNNDLDAWIRLHPVWIEVIEALKKLINQSRAYIATLKDGRSVKLILEAHDVNFPSERLLDQSQINTKAAALEKIRKHEACDKGQMIFIDDNITHIINPFLTGYDCYMAGWGNIPDEFYQIADEKGVPILTLEKIGMVLYL